MPDQSRPFTERLTAEEKAGWCQGCGDSGEPKRLNAEHRCPVCAAELRGYDDGRKEAALLAFVAAAEAAAGEGLTLGRLKRAIVEAA